MSSEQSINERLIKKFPILEGKSVVRRVRRVSVDIPYASFPEVLDFLSKDLKCTILCGITGLDEGEQFAVMYHLANADGTVVNAKTFVPRGAPVLASVTDRFPCAEIYERELVDLFGIDVKGLRPGKRYPLPDDWPQGEYPLRKDWKQPVKGGTKFEVRGT